MTFEDLLWILTALLWIFLQEYISFSFESYPFWLRWSASMEKGKKRNRDLEKQMWFERRLLQYKRIFLQLIMAPNSLQLP